MQCRPVCIIGDPRLIAGSKIHKKDLRRRAPGHFSIAVSLAVRIDCEMGFLKLLKSRYRQTFSHKKSVALNKFLLSQVHKDKSSATIVII